MARAEFEFIADESMMTIMASSLRNVEAIEGQAKQYQPASASDSWRLK